MAIHNNPLKEQVQYFLFVGFLLLMVVGVTSCVMVAPGIPYGEGQRIGKLYKVSEKGLLFKTYEGELSLELMTANSNGNMVNKIFNFSVVDPTMALQLEEAVKRPESVTLLYEEFLLRGYKYGNTRYTIVGVE